MMIETIANSYSTPIRNLQNLVTLIIFLVCISLYVGLGLQTDYNILTPTGLKASIQELGWLSPLLYMGILALSVIISPIPGAPLVIAGGAIWEFPLAGIYSIIGGFLGGMIAYFIARNLGASTIESLIGRSIDLSDKYPKQSRGWLVFFSRLIPVLPFGVISYGLGVARFPIKIYLIGTLLGMTPPTLLLSYFGVSLATLIP